MQVDFQTTDGSSPVDDNVRFEQEVGRISFSDEPTPEGESGCAVPESPLPDMSFLGPAVMMLVAKPYKYAAKVTEWDGWLLDKDERETLEAVIVPGVVSLLQYVDWGKYLLTPWGAAAAALGAVTAMKMTAFQHYKSQERKRMVTASQMANGATEKTGASSSSPGSVEAAKPISPVQEPLPEGE